MYGWRFKRWADEQPVIGALQKSESDATSPLRFSLPASAKLTLRQGVFSLLPLN